MNSDNRNPANASPVYLSTSDVLKETGVTLRQLYYWEKSDLVHPNFEKFGLRMYRRYPQSEVDYIRNIIHFLKEGYNLQVAARKAKEKSEGEK